jgi:two-component sensor histidine kinase
MLLDAECIAPQLVRYVMLVSELATNALEHTVTGEAGSFQVTVYRGEAALLIAVKDDGSDKIPLPAQLTGRRRAGPRPG